MAREMDLDLYRKVLRGHIQKQIEKNVDMDQLRQLREIHMDKERQATATQVTLKIIRDFACTLHDEGAVATSGVSTIPGPTLAASSPPENAVSPRAATSPKGHSSSEV